MVIESAVKNMNLFMPGLVLICYYTLVANLFVQLLYKSNLIPSLYRNWHIIHYRIFWGFESHMIDFVAFQFIYVQVKSNVCSVIPFWLGMADILSE